MTPPYGRIVVVGASLAGLRAAEALRRYGHTGELVIIGDEPHRPYDRPPLSKEFLAGTRDQVDLPVPADLDLRWRLGVPATGLDVDARRVRLADGATLRYDAAVLATGARARRWPGPMPAGVHTLRTVDDAAALAVRLAGTRRLLVVGGGFLGSEVAATARARGVPVTLVDRGAHPLGRAVGPHVGRFVAGVHREAGVDLRSGTTVRRFRSRNGGLAGATLADGSSVAADTAVVALGARPNVEWLAGSGLRIDRGLVCDAWCRPLRADGTPAPDLVAAGDLVRWPHPLVPGLLALEHWTHAVEQAAAAAATLLRPGTAPYAPVPSFWSDLHGLKIRAVGLPQRADTSTVVERDDARRRLLVTYRARGALVGAVAVNRTSALAGYRALLSERLELRTA